MKKDSGNNAGTAKVTTKPSVTHLPVIVHYGSTQWNKTSKQIDSAIMFVHDKRTDKIAKINLEETAPDSSLFEGQFSLSWNSDLVDPEIFIPPQSMKDDAAATGRFHQMISEKKVKPQPLLVRQEGNLNIYDVFDTKEQLAKAQMAYEREKEAKAKADQSGLIKPQASEAALQVAQLTAQQIMMAKLAKEAAEKEAERLRLEQLEQQKIEAKKKELEKMAAGERAKRKKQAEELAKKASAHYARGEYKESEGLYRQATDLDPENKSYYFQYGVSLYRVEKLNEALVVLDLAKVAPALDAERNYYLGLIHFKLKEYPQARSVFTELRNSKNPTLAPSAAFYEGLVFMAEENYKAAQNSFEFVIDASSDAVLDKKAEEYIEQIAALLAAKKLAAKKWIIDATAGLNYDSNILLYPNLSQSSPSHSGGARMSANANVERRIFYRDDRDMSAKLATTYMYSFDTKFATADPTELTFTLPYSMKGTAAAKGYKLTLTAGYDTIYMDFNSTGTREDLVNSYTAEGDLMMVMSDRWFSTYNLNIRDDQSKMTSTADTDMSATKVTVKKMETVFVDEAKKKALIGYIDYVDNAAKGGQQKYTKFDLGVIYSSPFEKYKNMTWNTAITTYLMSYPNYLGQGSRRDTDLTVTYGVTKVYNESWSWTNTASYTNNVSNLDANKYDKYSVTSSVTYNWDDAPKD